MDPGSTKPSRSRFARCLRRQGSGAAITVEVYDEQDSVVDLHRLGGVAAAAVADLRLWGAHVDLTLVDLERITELNREHMGDSGPTDVLAFPMDGPDHLDGPVALRVVRGGLSDGSLEPLHTWSPPGTGTPSPGAPGDGEVAGAGPDDRVLLGDVVLCPQVAAAQAQRADVDGIDELALLTVHGILHLLGHDHAEREERDAMFALTDLLLGSDRWRRDFGVH